MPRNGKKISAEQATRSAKKPVAVGAEERLGYRPPEAAKVIGVGMTTFYGLLKSGEIECRKIGGATIVTRQALKQYVDSLPPGR